MARRPDQPEDAPGQATIHDVARVAGVSTGTISRYLNRRGYVGAESARRIEEAIAATRYVPNSSARGLNTGRSGLLALILTDMENPFNAEFAQGMISRSLALGFQPLIDITQGTAQGALRALHAARGRRVEGIVIASSDAPEIDDELARLTTSGVPVTLIGATPDPGAADSVTSDTYGGARQAMEHLLELGHRRIAFIGAGSSRRIASGRRAGYERALEEAGIPFAREIVVEGELDARAGAEALEYLLKLRDQPTAIFAANDAAALGVIQQAARSSIVVPRELSVVGFDDVALASHSTPMLTTVHQRIRTMGATSAELLSERITGEATGDGRTVRLDCRLVVRASTAAPA